jgi:ribosomal protein S1
MGVLHVQLGDMVEVGGGPKGPRVIVDVVSIDLQSDKITASLATNDAADWLTIADDGKLACLDVRFTLKTDDGAFIFVEYQGRGDMEAGLIAAAPTFQTGSEKYAWLNNIQAILAGNVNLETGELVYNLYEVRVTM